MLTISAYSRVLKFLFTLLVSQLWYGTQLLSTVIIYRFFSYVKCRRAKLKYRNDRNEFFLLQLHYTESR